MNAGAGFGPDDPEGLGVECDCTLIEEHLTRCPGVPVLALPDEAPVVTCRERKRGRPKGLHSAETLPRRRARVRPAAHASGQAPAGAGLATLATVAAELRGEPEQRPEMGSAAPAALRFHDYQRARARTA